MPKTTPALSRSIEPRTRAFLEALAQKGGPPLYELSVKDARAVLSNAQAIEIPKMPADIEDRSIPGGPNGPVNAADLASVLVPDVFSLFARQAGSGHGEASSVLASVLPEPVNQMTPQGAGARGGRLERRARLAARTTQQALAQGG